MLARPLPVFLLLATAPALGADPVAPLADGTILCEAEEFHVDSPGWKRGRWGENYYSATFANAFLSRKAFLGAPETVAEPTTASIRVRVPEAGRYLVLTRYEAVYRFETRYDVRVEQSGKQVFSRTYGARENLKIWPFSQKLKAEVAWSWGAGENVVWEGHDAFVQLEKGEATIRLVAGPQTGDAARRNVDLVMLTRDAEQVAQRIEKERYLPLDGMLTQEGDLFLRLSVPKAAGETTLRIPNGTEHSPYWVHQRNWKPKAVTVAPGGQSEWTEVGSLLDTLNDGQWKLTAASKSPLDYVVEFGVRGADGKIGGIATFESKRPVLELAYDADTRYTQRIRHTTDVLRDLVEAIEAEPVQGKRPQRSIVYCLTFAEKPDDPEYTALRNRFLELLPVTETKLEQPKGRAGARGYVDVRRYDDEKLEAFLKDLQQRGLAESVGCVSLGDEIGLPRPRGDVNESFRTWLKGEKVRPEDVVKGAGDDWSKIAYSTKPETAESNGRLYYHSKQFEYAHGIARLKKRTDLIRRYLPNAGVGANFSPHHGHHYLGPTHKWITLFREGGMTMPWSEDYIWQVPVGTMQMNFITLDQFRAGRKHHPDGRIHYYVMPHSPGVTPENWRRQFYGDLMHGAKVLNLFEFRPVQHAYTENHVSGPENYVAVRRALYELGTFEDVVQDGRVARGNVALWFSEAADVWDDDDGSFGPAKRTLYTALLHSGRPLDFVTDEDALDGTVDDYEALYVTDRHVSRAATTAIAKWVEQGGRLFATAGAGWYDEFGEPNESFQKLTGVRYDTLEAPESAAVEFTKQELPFAEPADEVRHDSKSFPVFGALVRSKVTDGEVLATFAKGSPAVSRREVGRGSVVACQFQPGLSYFHPAIPRIPVDRGSHADTMSHFLPTEFDENVRTLIESPLENVPKPVDCSARLVESRLLQSKDGFVIPVVNWSPEPVEKLVVRVPNEHLPRRVTNVRLATGGTVLVRDEGDAVTFTFDLDVADAIVVQ